MEPYKDPDEFIKNLGADAFRDRIQGAKNSFLFEIDVLKREFDLEDPEQKTRFFNQAARKLLEFGEALERDNYIQAVSREHFINYEDLKRLVNTMGGRLGTGPGAGQRQKISSYQDRKKEKEDGPRKSQRLLLTWLIEEPGLFEKIKGIITPDDFKEELYHQVAVMVFEGHQKGRVDPAGILDHFIDDQEQYKTVASLFHARLTESLTGQERNKAFTETVYKVKKNSLDEASRRAADIGQLQEIIKAQSELKSLHISID
jgi:DNA primase